jgi:hypothetical protein
MNFEFLREEGVISHNDLDIFEIVDNADEAWEYILSWYEKQGTPLFANKE